MWRGRRRECLASGSIFTVLFRTLSQGPRGEQTLSSRCASKGLASPPRAHRAGWVGRSSSRGRGAPADRRVRAGSVAAGLGSTPATPRTSPWAPSPRTSQATGQAPWSRAVPGGPMLASHDAAATPTCGFARTCIWHHTERRRGLDCAPSAVSQCTSGSMALAQAPPQPLRS